ncbi:coenzyme F420-0:L-glutamate ligase [Angustibacter sp. Root456]|uniref:coenzyme F420-0:L-glutamate ligase n=1 Tax=Angustibacter sp. Root456 TaxID=1736539 RepID=UPI000B27EDD5|nr:coenzyme F420-0:L-glutamate ligase [Angustibacter sp. Root456]
MPDAEPQGVGVVPLQGFPEVQPGDSLADLIRTALVDSHYVLEPGDVLVVSSKVVSKALALVETTARDDVVARESVRVVATRRTPRGTASIVESAAGPVMAAAGVDASNTAPGTVLTLPHDADEVARQLRRDLRALGLALHAVVISDTAGRAWRTGQTDFALGAAGLVVVDDLRGTTDTFGQQLEVTERAVADEIAAAADLVKGKASDTPVALVRGLSAFVTEDDGPGARSLVRTASDWFRHGHVEAVRLALGVAADAVEAPSVTPEALAHKANRALQVALVGHDSVQADVTGRTDWVSISLRGSDFELGAVSERLLAALWAEDLAGQVEGDLTAPEGALVVRVEARA